MKFLLILTLPLWLGSCAVLGAVRESLALPSPAAPVTSPPPIPASPLAARAEASVVGREVAVNLTLRNTGTRPLALRYAAGVNWGGCGLPPFVALAREGGEPLPPPTLPPGAACPELLLARTLASGEVLTLRRTLPPLPPGAYTLTAWFDGELGGQAARVTAPPVRVQVP